MVNEKKGKEYTPVPVYNRKMARTVLRHRAERINGLHNVTRYVHDNFVTRKEMEKGE